MQPFGADLFACPYHDTLPKTAGVHALRFSGHQGKTVFAWLGLPAGDGPHPALVLLHGSGHQADRNWVELWRSRGFAAIAPDLEGQVVDADNHAAPDPAAMPRSSDAMAGLLDEAEQQWWFHALHACCRSLSLLVEHPQIDSHRIGLTGISRGAVLALMAAVRDQRLACVDLVYGSAFLGWQSGIAFPDDDHKQAWTRLWDPGPELDAIRCPSLWSTAARDPVFALDAWRRSCRACSGPVFCSLQHDFKHSQREGMLCIESARFASACLAGGEPLPCLDTPVFRHGRLCCDASGDVLRASLLHTADSADWRQRNWQLDEIECFGNSAHAELSPWCANAAIVFHCPDGCQVSSDVVNLL